MTFVSEADAREDGYREESKLVGRAVLHCGGREGLTSGWRVKPPCDLMSVRFFRLVIRSAI